MRRYRQFGEIRGIGATSHVLDIEDKRIVVDWGVEFERNASGSNTSLPPSIRKQPSTSLLKLLPQEKSF